MENLSIYNAVRTVPPEAQKEIAAGRLKGKTDINPMWRIKTLTAQFGPCGFGWRYEIREKRLERGAKDEIAAFVDVDLYVKADGEWSMPIPGTGGAAFVASESKGLYTSDECFKMALTDAISVACKALGVGADIYWAGDRTKYDAAPKPASRAQLDTLKSQLVRVGWSEGKAEANIAKRFGQPSVALAQATGEQVCWLIKYLETKPDFTGG